VPCCIKSGQQHLAAGRENFIFFLCPLDGEQFTSGHVPAFCQDPVWDRRRCSTSAYTMRTSASVNPAMLMAVGLIAVFYFALRLSDKRKNG